MADDVLIRVDGVSKKFCRSLKRSLWYGVQDTVADLFGQDGSRHGLRSNEFWAVDDVSFELRRGECLGLIGRNGAGKTTLLKMLNGLVKPDRGRIEIRGRIGALISLGAGFNPILTGRENVYINGAVLGLSRKEIDAKYDEIVDFSEVGEFIDTPVQNYSSGMQVRLGFAVATAMHPDVLLLDEVLAVGDANFRMKCGRRLGEILHGAAVILVSHSAHYIRRLCNEALLLHHGKVTGEGRPDEILAAYAATDTQQARAASSVLGDHVWSAELIKASATTWYGGHLTIRMSISVSNSTRCDQAYLNITDNGDAIHAQVILDGVVGELEAGTTEFVITVGPLFLSKGHFVGSLALYGAGGKNLATLANSFKFENDGPVSLGTCYYPPAQVSVSRLNDMAVEPAISS